LSLICRQLVLLFVALFFVCFLSSDRYTAVQALKAEFRINQEMCFFENLNPKGQVVVRYKFPGMGTPGYPHSIYVSIVDPLGNVVLSQAKTEPEAQMYYLATERNAGEFKICMTPKAATSFSFAASPVYRVDVDVGVDDDAIHYDKLESRDRLEKMSGLLEKLKDKLQYIEEDQSYFKTREERFRITSESIASRTLWYSLAMISLLGSLGTWQVFTMKNFFHTKKMA